MYKKIDLIAEIGINHDGSQSVAAELVERAAAAGSTAVKFQYRNLSNTYSSTAKEIGDEILQHEIRKNYLEPSVIISLSEMAKDLGLQAGISFFDRGDMSDFNSDINVFDFFKVPSAELMNKELKSALVNTGKYIYLSTGGHSEGEIDFVLNDMVGDNWMAMHCVSNYPVDIQNPKLGYIKHMQQRWGKDVGYSSHDDNWEVCLLAMQMGVVAIERHITLDKNANGLDHSSSSTPDEFNKMANFADNLKIINMGDDARIPNQGELLNRQNLGRSYFAVRDIKAGEILTRELAEYRSPNIGINQTDLDNYTGRKLLSDLKKGNPITRSVFSRPQRLPDQVIEFTRRHNISLPVRLHDIGNLSDLFPIGAYEYHLSFEEVAEEIDLSNIDRNASYSVHLPDYINSTQLIDPFSHDDVQRDASLDLLERTVSIAESLQDLTGKKVPIVGSFSVVHSSLQSFYREYSFLLSNYEKRGVEVMPQWLPPIAWYFGGSVKLNAMNHIADIDYIKLHDIKICMDFCHLFMGRNYYGYNVDELLDSLNGNIRHIHIADSLGIDGEGIAFGEGDPDNLSHIGKALKYDCIKVIEVWQGHLDNGAGFRKALCSLEKIYNE